MSQEDWEDLLYDLTNNTLNVDDKRDQRYKLAAHMAKLEQEHEKLKIDMLYLQRRVAKLEAQSSKVDARGKLV